MSVLFSSIILYCRYIRQEGNLPFAGCRELYELCRRYFKEKFVIGRDRFYDLLRSNELMLRKKRYRPRTTNSCHRFRIYPDLVNTSPKFIPRKSGELVVGDITYIYTREGFAYLSLLTDAYSRYIVGHCLYPTLAAEGCVKALKMALDTYRHAGIAPAGLVHHSDRGIQYASREYTEVLNSENISISMTQSGDPLHNALAERMNNTLKNGWLFNNGDLSLDQAASAVDKAIRMYNEARPHNALDMRTPQELFKGTDSNPLLHWNV